MSTSSKYYVTMTDKFMSGWGKAAGLTNKLVIECDNYKQAEQIERAARKRNEMKFVNICIKKPSYPASRYLTSSKHFSNMGGAWLEGWKEETPEFTKISRDTKGNPRYVCHFLNFITDFDKRNFDIKKEQSGVVRFEKGKPQEYKTKIQYLYLLAIAKAKKIGGRKYDTKQFPMSIVFQCYNIEELERYILELTKPTQD